MGDRVLPFCLPLLIEREQRATRSGRFKTCRNMLTPAGTFHSRYLPNRLAQNWVHQQVPPRTIPGASPDMGGAGWNEQVERACGWNMPLLDGNAYGSSRLPSGQPSLRHLADSSLGGGQTQTLSRNGWVDSSPAPAGGWKWRQSLST